MNRVFVERAENVFVGGVNSPVRSFKRVGGEPLVVRSANGAFIEDVSGNKYLDLVMSYGPHLFGHQYAPIVDAVKSAIAQGFCFGMTSEREILWGEKIISLLPDDWRVRALSSGTEACMTAVRLARAHTDNEILIKCSGHYHGHGDSLLFDSGSGVASLSAKPIPESAGVPTGLGEVLKVIPFNDETALERVFAEHAGKIAALIFEPVMGNMGVVLPTREFLSAARRLTNKHKAVLILDEVMTGFRVGLGSAFRRFEIQPDLVTFGKIVGGGLPLAALAGPVKIMNGLAPTGSTYQAGTLSGNPVATAAGFAMLEAITEVDPYPQLEALGARLQSVIEKTAAERGIPVSVVRCGSMLSTHFRAEAPTNAEQTRDIDHERFKKFFWQAIKYGLMLPPSPFEAYFLSMAHLAVEDQLLSQFQKTFGAI